MCLITREDVETEAGIDQLCARTKLGIEGAIPYAVNDIFNENKVNGWGVLLVDAKKIIHLILLLELQLCGMQGFCGQEPVVFCLTRIMGEQH